MILLTLTALASVVVGVLGTPPRLGLPPLVTVVGGGAILVAGVGLALWLVRYRSPFAMVVSTYFTFVKMFARAPVSSLGGRTEQLVVSGPQRYVRHPLYLGATALFLGWAIFMDSTSSLLGAGFVVLWFRFVQIPFEEKELRAIFGDQYSRYCEKVPMLVPLAIRKAGPHPDAAAP